MKRTVAAAAAAVVVGLLAWAGDLAGADSFTPVRLAIAIAPVARLHRPLKVTVAVTADAAVLDVASAPLQIRVKLAPECGGSFTYTPGTVLVDRQLTPQPTTGRPYSAQATGSGRPTSYGMQSVCVYLEEEADYRQFATDTSEQVNVSKPCTRSAARYDAARTALARARRELRAAKTSAARARLRRRVAKRSANAGSDRRVALEICGPGVPL